MAGKLQLSPKMVVIPQNDLQSGAEEVGTQVLKCNSPFRPFLYLSKLTLQKETLWIHLMFSYPDDIKLILFNIG